MATDFAKANEAFVLENYEEAVQLYTSAIEADATKDDYYLARAHAYIKSEKYNDAVSDAAKAIELNPTNAKAYLRLGVAHFHQENYAKAKDSFLEGSKLDGTDKNLSTWIRKCEAELDLASKKATGDSQLVCGASIGSSSQPLTPGSSTSSQAVESPVPKSPAAVDKPTATVIPMPSGPKTRYDWYQTETHVIVTILIKNVKPDDLKTNFQEHSMSCSIRLATGSDYSLELDLENDIVPSQCQTRVMTTKVEIKLKKAEGILWKKLECEGTRSADRVKQIPQSVVASQAPKYPSSSHHTRDWDKIAAELTQEEKDEKLEGDAALNKLFQQIYADGTDEVKKAMNKSFVESGGTVLSTNWKEIAEKTTDVKPPDGMEYKQYS